MNSARELARFGLNIDQLRNSLVGMPPHLEHEWCVAGSHWIQDEAFCLHVGQNFLISDFGLFGYFLQSQATLRDAVLALKAFTASINDGDFRLVESGKIARIEIHPRNPLAWSALLVEGRLRCLPSLIRQIAATDFKPLAIHHRHLAPSYTAEMERSHEAPLFYGRQADAVYFESRYLDQALPGANPGLASALKHAIDNQANPPPNFGWAGQVRSAISVGLGQDHLSLQGIAKQFKVKPHVLKYMLNREGTSFEALLDETRRKAVLNQLLSIREMTAEKMAEILGYQNTRQFYRSFKKWTGTTPTQYAARGKPPKT